MTWSSLNLLARSGLLLALVAGCASPNDPGEALPPGALGGGADAGANQGTGTSGSVTDPTGTGSGTGTSSSSSDGGSAPSGGSAASNEGGADGQFSALTAPLPSGKDYSGWTWVEVAGSKCRDGSPAGYYWRRGAKSSLLVYLNGGGACADPFFCGLNPVNVEQDLPIEWLIFGTGNLVLGPDARRQIAPDEGVFKKDPRNPVSDWNMIYVPYCTGDIHSGSREDVEVPGVEGKQQFVGYKNLGLFLNSFGPSFGNAEQVLLTGSSAGGFGTLLNFDRFQEYFNKWKIEVLAVSDSGLPMRDPNMAACLQSRWRKYWGLNDAFPKDCTACQGDAGGLTEAAFKYYFSQKYAGRFLGGLVTSVNDQIIRAFFAPGLSSEAGKPDDCTLDPGLNTITSALFLGQYSGDKYREGLADVADNLVGPNQIGYYVLPGDGHMHLWRKQFYEKNETDQTIAEWLGDILKKKASRQGDGLLHPK